MNEDELKSRLQKDAEAFGVDFSEELLHQIMMRTENTPMDVSGSVSPKTLRKPSSGHFRPLTLPAARFVAALLIGLGIWGICNPAGRHPRNSFPAGFTNAPQKTQNPHSVGLDEAASGMNSLDFSSDSLFNLTDETGNPVLLSSTDWDTYTHDIPRLAKNFFHNTNFVQNSSEMDFEEEEGEADGKISLSKFIHTSSLVLNAPVVWIFEEDAF